MQIPHCTRTRQGGRPVGNSVERSRVQAEEFVTGGEKQFLILRSLIQKRADMQFVSAGINHGGSRQLGYSD
jgi:hypothetical protein